MPCEIKILKNDGEEISICGDCKNIVKLSGIICPKQIRRIFIEKVPMCIISSEGESK